MFFTCENKTKEGKCSAVPGFIVSCFYTNETPFGQEEDCGMFTCSKMFLEGGYLVKCSSSMELCKETKRLKRCPKVLERKVQRTVI